MIYSPDDVKRMLDEIRKLPEKWREECLRGDAIKEEAADELDYKVKAILERL